MPTVSEVVTPGQTGAKRQSWRRSNPREVLKRLIDNDPSLTEAEASDACWQIVHKNSEQMATIFEYWFANNYRSLVHPAPRKPRPVRTPAQRAVLTSQIREQIERKIEERARIVLLEMILPTGKQLRDSTREELIACGGWLVRVAERLDPDQTVGEAGLSEDDIAEAYHG